jgi:hypothetical protein
MPHEVPAPIRPRKLGVTWEEQGDLVRIEYRPQNWAVAGFLLFWLTGWTVGCVAMAWKLLTAFEWAFFLFSIPFYAAEIFVFGLILTMLFYRETLELDALGARYQSTILWPWQQRIWELTELLRFEVDEQSDSESTTRRLQLESTGKSLAFCTDLRREQLEWLAWSLNAHLAKLRPVSAEDLAAERALEGQTDPAGRPAVDPATIVPAVLELRPPAEAEVNRPDDSRWHSDVSLDALAFRERGRWSLAAIGGLLFVNAFWNGIVAVFVCLLWGLMPGEKAPRGVEWWVMFVFLIPFQLIGLAMIVGFVAALLDPLRVTRWEFRRDRVLNSYRWLGLGPQWTYEIRELDRLELRRIDPDTLLKQKHGQKQLRSNVTSATELSRYSVALVDRQGADVCKIQGLTLAEGCWFAYEILHERPNWFVA